MKNLKHELELAYKLTCTHLNNPDKTLGEMFTSYEQFGLIYYMISALPKEFSLSTKLLFADGGIKSFMIFYTIGELTILIVDWSDQSEQYFKSFDQFVDWLQSAIDRMPQAKTVISFL